MTLRLSAKHWRKRWQYKRCSEKLKKDKEEAHSKAEAKLRSHPRLRIKAITGI